MGNSSDLIIREAVISAGHQQAAVVYLDGMVDNVQLQQSVITPLLNRIQGEHITLAEIKESILESIDVKFIYSFRQSLDQLMDGSVLLLINGHKLGLAIPLPGWEERSITESQIQTVVRGPRDSFNETMRTNTTLIRRRIKDPNLRVVSIKVGHPSKTDVTVVYLEGKADAALVQQMLDKLRNSKQHHVLESEYLEEILLADQPKSIFPTIYNTDRPDSIARAIMAGRIAFVTDNTPFVLFAPAFFTDFLASAEDRSQSVVFSRLVLWLRYISLCICLLAPSVYIALTTFHQDMLPTQLLLSLAAQREGIPFPAFVEALIMEITFEILREAGIRMPRTVGQAMSIVGTIVVGQAAVEATIVSAVMVIIVSITAISSFVIPAYSMSIPIRMIRFLFMGLAASFGAYGLTIGVLLLIVHLCSLKSFGNPYTGSHAQNGKKDTLFRISGLSLMNSQKRG
nr:spore germination protein [Paenibacillus protaetiae]